MEVNISKLIQDRQNQFIEKRTIIESEVNGFLQSLEKLDLDVQTRLNVKVGTTCRMLLPSLWMEPFDIEQYNKEKENLDAYIAAVKGVCDEINQEALKCLQD